MERKVDGFDEELAVVMAYDDQGKTEGRDTIFNSIFGKTFDTVQTTAEPLTTSTSSDGTASEPTTDAEATEPTA